jgi:signal transduction histidine kinase
MNRSRWWTIAVLGTAVVLGALVIADQPPTWRLVSALCAIAALVLVWFTLGRRADPGTAAVLPFLAAVIVIAGVGTALSPSMATIQCLAYPLIWTRIERVRGAVGACIALATSVGVGIYLGAGANESALAQTLAIQFISLAFSLALGIWITGIASRSDERQLLIDKLEAAQEELAALSRDAGAASERERLAREIHDTIAQDLTGLVMTAQRGIRELGDGNSAGARAQLEILEENARNALAETRALVASGAAVGVDASGLATAVQRLAERFERETGVTVILRLETTGELERDREVVLLRCAQEALANVRKHSGATRATLTLDGIDNTVTLTVHDNGSGFDPARPADGFGLTGMRDRLALAGGALTVTSSPTGGTTLVAALPASMRPAAGGTPTMKTLA